LCALAIYGNNVVCFSNKQILGSGLVYAILLFLPPSLQISCPWQPATDSKFCFKNSTTIPCNGGEGKKT
jgi:hypothetical protein